MYCEDVGVIYSYTFRQSGQCVHVYMLGWSWRHASIKPMWQLNAHSLHSVMSEQETDTTTEASHKTPSEHGGHTASIIHCIVIFVLSFYQTMFCISLQKHSIIINCRVPQNQRHKQIFRWGKIINKTGFLEPAFLKCLSLNASVFSSAAVPPVLLCSQSGTKGGGIQIWCM